MTQAPAVPATPSEGAVSAEAVLTFVHFPMHKETA
jgi:hypothetical protein